MVRGVNRYVPHAFTPAPFPDPDCPPHFYAHGENPTYRAFGELMSYSNRVCHLIDGGISCPDVALLYNAESVWAGDYTSNIPACRHLGQAQVDFHIIPADVFADTDEYPMSFDGKTLIVNQVEYHALVISGCAFLDARVAEFVIKSVKDGFLVVFTDRKPTGIVGASEEENAQFEEAIRDILVVPVKKIGTCLKEKMQVNTLIKPDDRMMTTYHYKLEDHDEYLVLNENAEETFAGEVIAKAEGIPVRCYPWENRLEAVNYETQADGLQKIALSIAPLELCVIIFIKDEAEYKQLETEVAIARANVNDCHSEKIMIDTFEVGYVTAKDYLAQLKQAGESLHSGKAVATASGKETVKAPFTGMQKKYPDFSGYYIYEAKVPLNPGQNYVLEIDDVYETAEVFVNGTSIGTKVQGPYKFEIPSAILTEENDLRIEIATLLERKVRAMGVNFAAMSAHRPMSPTGILGQVSILAK